MKVLSPDYYGNIRLVMGDKDEIIPVSMGRALAKKQELDLVVVNASTDPPVCKILDLSKFEYDKKKQRKENAQKPIKTKEVKFRYGIAEGDFKLKVKNAARILSEGHRVKVIEIFQGRKSMFLESGKQAMTLFQTSLGEIISFEIISKPKKFGATYEMLIGPKKEEKKQD